MVKFGRKVGNLVKFNGKLVKFVVGMMKIGKFMVGKYENYEFLWLGWCEKLEIYGWEDEKLGILWSGWMEI